MAFPFVFWFLRTPHYRNYFLKCSQWPLAVKFKYLCVLGVCSIWTHVFLDPFPPDQPDITVPSLAFTHPLDLWSSHVYLGTFCPPHPTRWPAQLTYLKPSLYMVSPLTSFLNVPMGTFLMLCNAFYFTLMCVNTIWSPLSPWLGNPGGQGLWWMQLWNSHGAWHTIDSQ